MQLAIEGNLTIWTTSPIYEIVQFFPFKDFSDKTVTALNIAQLYNVRNVILIDSSS